MKKHLLLAVFSLAMGFTACKTTDSATRDELSLLEAAAQTAAASISRTIKSGSIIAVVRISSQDANLSQQIISWLENRLVASGNLTTVSRERINEVLKEQHLGLSSYIDQESAQRIGHLLGAEYVLAGDIKRFEGKSIFNIQVLKTEEGVLAYSESFDITDSDFFPGAEYAEMSYAPFLPLAFYWGDGLVGGGGTFLELYYSPLPYLSVGFGGMGFAYLEGNEFSNGEDYELVLFFSTSIYLGAIVPITKRINWLGYGGLSFKLWSSDEGLIASYENEDENDEGEVSYSYNVINPVFQTGFAYKFTDEIGLSLTYRGEWFADGKYRNSVSIGFLLRFDNWNKWKL
ncbi:CsgG/HfaB family protein [Breznakiellaceae bacterium SP9]